MVAEEAFVCTAGYRYNLFWELHEKSVLLQNECGLRDQIDKLKADWSDCQQKTQNCRCCLEPPLG